MSAPRKGIADRYGMIHETLDGVAQIHGESGPADAFRFTLVASRYNTELTESLVAEAVGVLRNAGTRPEQIRVVWVPGAFEIPAVLEQCARAGQVDALIAIGAVLEGETPHATAINESVARSLNEVSRQYGIPVIDSVVVARTMAQAVERCMGKSHNRGAYAAKAAIEMAYVFHRLTKQG